MENFKFEELPENNSDNKPTDRLKNKIKTGVALGAVAFAALSGEGCAPGEKGDSSNVVDNSKQPHVEKVNTTGRLTELRKRLNERNENISRMILDNERAIAKGADLSTNVFLKSYYQFINKGHVEADDTAIFQEGLKMRVLEIAKKKGINLDLSKGANFKIDAGMVPKTATVNGVDIPITDSDYTDKEMAVVESQKGLGSQSSPEPIKTAPKSIRTSPDFDGKNADF